METSKIKILEKALDREKAARKAAEAILEEKSAELFKLSEQLKRSNNKLEELLNRKTSELEGVFKTIVDAYVVMDFSGEVISMNEAAKELLGYDVDNEPINLLKLVKKGYREYTLEVFKELFIHGKFNNYKAVILTKNNEEKSVQINASIIYGENGEPIAAQGIARDITNEIITNEKLKESEDRLSTLITNLHTGVLLEDENRKIILTNTEFCSMFSIGASPEALEGMDCSNSAEDTKYLFKEPEKFLERINHLLQEKKPVFSDELELVDGRVFERNYIPIYSKGAYKGHLWSYSDITIKKNYRERLKAEKEKYSNIIDNMNLGLIEIDTKGYIKFANNNFCKISGFSREELYNAKAETLLLPAKEVGRGKELRARRKRGISDSYEIEVKTKSNEIRHWLLSGAPTYDLNGKINGSIGIHLDITEQKKLEIQKETLLKNLEEQNERLNEYAHIVSHDLKSPLRNISALLSWTIEDFKDKLGRESLKNLNLMQQRVEKMDHLIENILQYSSIGQPLVQKTSINLNHLIAEITDILYIPSNISVKTLKEMPIIIGDPTQIQQVFLNLISNAVNYNDKEKGIIEIDFTNDKSWYTFSIKDNGIGIAEENQKKIFTIFKSLGNHENSTGIGLSIVKKIIDLHKGKIWVESEVGLGSTFFFSLKN
ncbi:PAS domain S-box protein [Zunongwangia sp. F363]|uniref:histidine kinase n=1 Tax=Autumnicola tepida TaxID=3075595 RepID=A0ABU3CF11_9FLAO|nr:PAS domain S-box protein [Zunongwangia sp. F363]MDT0644929.1 PAS domain S-box protein [Zunongwangia sp. F363]